MTMPVQQRLVELLGAQAGRESIADVRIGLGYCAVQLGSGHAGVAATPPSEAPGCTHLGAAGTLVGRTSAELLAMLTDAASPLARAVGLATANALLASPAASPTSRDDVLSLLDLAPADHVVMFGLFAPLVPRLREIGCRVDVVELDPRRASTVPPGSEAAVSARCTIAIITGTTLINGTFDEVTSGLRRTRAAVLLGPSTPMCPEAFRDTPITHLSGSRVRNVEGVLRVVSEGGGTMKMRPFIDFETVRTDSGGRQGGDGGSGGLP
jgi:uncharacterized protein